VIKPLLYGYLCWLRRRHPQRISIYASGASFSPPRYPLKAKWYGQATFTEINKAIHNISA